MVSKTLTWIQIPRKVWIRTRTRWIWIRNTAFLYRYLCCGGLRKKGLRERCVVIWKQLHTPAVHQLPKSPLPTRENHLPLTSPLPGTVRYLKELSQQNKSTQRKFIYDWTRFEVNLSSPSAVANRPLSTFRSLSHANCRIRLFSEIRVYVLKKDCFVLQAYTNTYNL